MQCCCSGKKGIGMHDCHSRTWRARLDWVATFCADELTSTSADSQDFENLKHITTCSKIT
jgi:hypothetical protein